MTTSAATLACTSPASKQDGHYPRPLMVREKSTLLDRKVGFAHDDDLVGLEERWYSSAEPFSREIQLPFPPESKLSGIEETGYHPCVWYRIEITSADLRSAGHSEGRRLVLHFGAVDYETTVFVDGQQVGTHLGGQTPFSFDITTALDPEVDTHVVTVRAFDDPLDCRQPRGKQDWLPEPHVIWYQRTTGIWRTVWLESVPPLHLTRLVFRPDITSGRVEALVELNRRPAEATQVEIAIAFDGDLIGHTTTLLAEQAATVTVDLTRVTNGVDLERFVWMPQRPVLMDAGVVVHGEIPDETRSYLGYRQVGASQAGMTINSFPIYLRSVLEQGYWHESCLTPPSVEAMKAEVQLMLDMGLNNCRIHQKVEDPRFLFFCDTMGLTVWGETASAYTFDSVAIQRFAVEWVDIVRANEGHPSIIAWTPFNESWGITHVSRDPAQAAFSRGISDLTRALDPTRPVISNDGWEHADSDLLTIHDYEWRREVLADRYTLDGIQTMLATTGPAGRVLVVGEDQSSEAPVLLTEFGGVEFVTVPSADQTWGYSSARDADDYERRMRDIMEPVLASSIVRGFCWTQLTDTLQEANGLCDENRVPKLPIETLRAIFTGEDTK